jgi:hypothetical protein
MRTAKQIIFCDSDDRAGDEIELDMDHDKRFSSRAPL